MALSIQSVQSVQSTQSHLLRHQCIDSIGDVNREKSYFQKKFLGYNKCGKRPL